MSAISGVRTFDVAGVNFCEIPEGDVTIDDPIIGETPEGFPVRSQISERVHVRRFALAQKPASNSELDNYARSMDKLTHGRVARRFSDGRPFVVERTRADGSDSQPGAGIIAFDHGSSVLVRDGALVRLVPDPNRYVTKLGERAVHFIGPHLPATLMTGFETLGWADFLAKESGRDVTLPTSVQWQYAKRGGQGRLFEPRGSPYLDPRKVIHNHDGKRQGPAPLNREGWQGFLNQFGLLDMTGNVWEPTLIEGPITPEMAFQLRWFGGSWYYEPFCILVLTGGFDYACSDGSDNSSEGVRVALAQD